MIEPSACAVQQPSSGRDLAARLLLFNDEPFVITRTPFSVYSVYRAAPAIPSYSRAKSLRL